MKSVRVFTATCLVGGDFSIGAVPESTFHMNKSM